MRNSCRLCGCAVEQCECEALPEPREHSRSLTRLENVVLQAVRLQRRRSLRLSMKASIRIAMTAIRIEEEMAAMRAAETTTEIHSAAARYMMQKAYAMGMEDHEVEEWSTDSRIEAYTGLVDCHEDVREAIARLLSQ